MTPNIEGLRQVVRVIEELPDDDDHQFQMGHWMSCGTSGCLIGWAASDPWFEERGLTLRAQGLDTIGRMVYLPTFEEDAGFHAVMAFFNLTYDTTTYLFTADTGAARDREAALNKVREYIRDHE